MPTRILIVDSHEVMRAGIMSICASRPDLECVGETDRLESAVEIARKTLPDVLVYDPDPYGPEGDAFVHGLVDAMSSVRILAFTSHHVPELAARVLSAGAAGYLTKDASPEEIVMAIRSLTLGRIFVSHAHAGVPRPSRDRVRPRGRQAATFIDISGLPQLAGREWQVLAMFAEGKADMQIAHHFFLSVKTVEMFRTQMMKKQGLGDAADLMRFARQAIA